MSVYEQAVELTSHMTLAEKARLLEHLSTEVRHDIEVNPQGNVDSARLRAWQMRVERTAGALADDPIERAPQGDYEQRDAIL